MAPPLSVLLEGVRRGPAMVWVADGAPCVLFGAVPLDDTTASIWMVGTPGLEKHKSFLLRRVRSVVADFNERWPLLVNTADARNTLHHRFIAWAGFTFFAERRLNGLRFLDFARINPIV